MQASCAGSHGHATLLCEWHRQVMKYSNMATHKCLLCWVMAPLSYPTIPHDSLEHLLQSKGNQLYALDDPEHARLLVQLSRSSLIWGQYGSSRQ